MQNRKEIDVKKKIEGVERSSSIASLSFENLPSIGHRRCIGVIVINTKHAMMTIEEKLVLCSYSLFNDALANVFDVDLCSNRSRRSFVCFDEGSMVTVK